jgi:hypothetical protein
MVIFSIVSFSYEWKNNLIIEFIQWCSFLLFQYLSSKYLHHKGTIKLLTLLLLFNL